MVRGLHVGEACYPRMVAPAGYLLLAMLRLMLGSTSGSGSPLENCQRQRDGRAGQERLERLRRGGSNRHPEPWLARPRAYGGSCDPRRLAREGSAAGRPTSEREVECFRRAGEEGVERGEVGWCRSVARLRGCCSAADGEQVREASSFKSALSTLDARCTASNWARRDAGAGRRRSRCDEEEHEHHLQCR